MIIENNANSKILDLLETGDKTNIRLALSIIKSNKLDFDFTQYEGLFQALVKHDIVKDAKRLETKLVRIFSIKTLGFNLKELESLSPFLSIFTSLKRSGMAGEFKKTPEGLSNAYSLESLDLSENRLEELSPSLLNLKKLKSLSISFNQSLSLDSVTNVVCQMKQLTQLGLVMNGLKQIPEEIENLVNLKHLNLASNNFSSLPESLGNLHNLESLSLYGNYSLCGLPECIYQLPKLNWLTISRSNATKDQLSKLNKLRPQCLIKYI